MEEARLSVDRVGSAEPTVVVTGASGFIGRAVCTELAWRGAVVYAVSRTAAAPVPGVRSTVVADYGDLPVPGGAICVHLAGSNDARYVAEHCKAELESTARLAKRLAAGSVARIVYGSSAQVYGDHVPAPRSEDEVVSPATPYAAVKRAAEEIFLAHGHVVARIANVYGSGMPPVNVLCDLLRQIPGTGYVHVRDLSPVRDFIHVADVARGLADLALGANNGVFNLGTGIGTSVGELAAMLLKSAAEEGRRVVEHARSDRPSWLVLDPRKMKATYDWKPSIHLAQGLGGLLARPADMTTR